MRFVLGMPSFVSVLRAAAAAREGLFGALARADRRRLRRRAHRRQGRRAGEASTSRTIRSPSCCGLSPPISPVTAPPRAPPSRRWPSARTRACSACAGCMPRRRAAATTKPPAISPAPRTASRRCRGRPRPCSSTGRPRRLGKGARDRRDELRRQADRQGRPASASARCSRPPSPSKRRRRRRTSGAGAGPRRDEARARSRARRSCSRRACSAGAATSARPRRLIEQAWPRCQHPDIARAYLDVRPGDSTTDRLERARTLMGIASFDPVSRMLVARAAMGAKDFVRRPRGDGAADRRGQDARRSA